MNKLTDFERTLLWMAIRYACNRQTIASSTLPQDIIKNWYHRLSEHDKQTIVSDLKRESQYNDNCFGDKNIDNDTWQKFILALNEEEHFNVICIDGNSYICFKYGDKFYPLEKYIENPHIECFIPTENIIENKI